MSNPEEKVVNGKVYVYENNRWVLKSSEELDPHDPDYSWDWDLENRR